MTRPKDRDSSAPPSTKPRRPRASRTSVGSQRSEAGSQNTAAGSQNTAAGSQNTAAGSQNTAAGSQNTAAGSQNTAAGSQKTEAGSQKTEAGSQKTEAEACRTRAEAENPENAGADRILWVSRRFAELFASLTGLDLSSTERQKLGGHLFLNAEVFVEQVGQVLTQQKALFPDILLDGDALLARQRRANAWYVLRDKLQTLLQVAQDTYLYEQSTAIQQGKSVIQQVLAEAELPYDVGLPRDQRQLAIEPAVQSWQERGDRIAATRDKHKKEKALASGEPPQRKRPRPDRKANQRALLDELSQRANERSPS